MLPIENLREVAVQCSYLEVERLTRHVNDALVNLLGSTKMTVMFYWSQFYKRNFPATNKEQHTATSLVTVQNRNK